MAESLVQKTVFDTSVSGTTIPIPVSSTGSGNLLVVFVQLNAGLTVSGVSDGTSSFTQASGAAVSLTGVRELDCWYLLSSNSGKTTITVTRNGAADTEHRIAWFFEVSPNAGTTWGFDLAGNSADQSAGASTTLNGFSLSTTATGSVFGAMLETTGTASSMLGGNEFTFGDESAYGSATAYLLNASSGSHQPKWVDSVSNDTFSTITVAFKEVSAGPGPGSDSSRVGMSESSSNLIRITVPEETP